MIPKDEWVWYGFPCHLHISRRGAYHLCTCIGDRLVSTVGAYFPNDGGETKLIDLSLDAYYETYVFACDGEDMHGNPSVASWEQLAQEHYRTSTEATRGHNATCERIASVKYIEESS